MSGWYTKYQSVASSSPVTPRQNSLPAMEVEWYEGALEPTAPSTGQCTTIDINSTDCATLATALTAWKSDPSASATTQYYFQAFLGKASGTITSGAMPNSVSPSWLTLKGVSVWGMNSNVSFIAPAFYQTYNGFAAFSHREHIKQLF